MSATSVAAVSANIPDHSRDANLATSNPNSRVNGATPRPTVRISEASLPSIRAPKSSVASTSSNNGMDWGKNFWVTLVEPQSDTPFYACPATGDCQWDAPVGCFVLPPSSEGEWWELVDESRNLPYYYHTKSGETIWEKPQAFVIPLGVIQSMSTLGRRLSQNSNARSSFLRGNGASGGNTLGGIAEGSAENSRAFKTRSRSFTTDAERQFEKPASANGRPAVRRTFSNEARARNHAGYPVHLLSPIPGSDASSNGSSPKKISGGRKSSGSGRDSPPRSRSPPSAPSSLHLSPSPVPPQSLDAAAEMLATLSVTSTPTHTSTSNGVSPSTPSKPKLSTDFTLSPSKNLATPTRPSPSRLIPLTPDKSQQPSPKTPVRKIPQRMISNPTLDQDATRNLTPVKAKSAGQPILVNAPRASNSRGLSTGHHPVLPQDLASDIKQFGQSDYAKQHFSKHKTGFIFRRRIPVEIMMTWQKLPLSSPLLDLNRKLHKDAVRIFKIIQQVMGDRDRERPFQRNVISSLPSAGGSMADEQHWVLAQGIRHGELRDEIYCQLIKQLNGNPSPESVFKGWQFFCVLLITFPPSKDFETYLRAFMLQHISRKEGRIDVMAKYCLQKLAMIAKKGPRGKPPTIAEIEIASDAAFNPSTFGESLDAIFRLQERTYPKAKVPIVLPFLADGILALGGTKSEGIFRVPGDGELVGELKLRIDQGYYNLNGIDDPHVPASLLKLWLRELLDPLVPNELYNDCIACASDPEACIAMVSRLPTINRRVLLFVVSFLQLFWEEKVQAVTKMTSANIALVMAPNLLRCNSDSMAVVFTNAQFEQTFVHNLLVHLRCNEVDLDYVPVHGLGATQIASSKSRGR